jgi:hypothetical protein
MSRSPHIYVVYTVVFGAGVYNFMRLVRQGLPEPIEGQELRPEQRPARPLSAATTGPAAE